MLPCHKSLSTTEAVSSGSKAMTACTPSAASRHVECRVNRKAMSFRTFVLGCSDPRSESSSLMLECSDLPCKPARFSALIRTTGGRMTLRFQSCATFRSRPSMFFARTAPAGGRALAFLLEASIRHARPPYPGATDTVCQTVFKVVLPPDLEMSPASMTSSRAKKCLCESSATTTTPPTERPKSSTYGQAAVPHAPSFPHTRDFSSSFQGEKGVCNRLTN